MSESQHLTRALVMQGLYQWLLTGQTAEDIESQIQQKGANQALLHHWLHTCVAEAEVLRQHLTPFLDRPLAQISPVEHALLLMGACELIHDPQTPRKVVLNEMVLLAKEYGGANGHKFINGVLNKLALGVRGEAAV